MYDDPPQDEDVREHDYREATPDDAWNALVEMAYWLNDMEPEERTKRLNSQRYWSMWEPRPQPRCPMCGSVAWELKDGQTGVSEARCTEETCNHRWEWKV
jgi:hypothetical protein